MLKERLGHHKLGGKEYNELGTVDLMLQIPKPIWNTGKAIILDSGFCILKRDC